MKGLLLAGHGRSHVVFGLRTGDPGHTADGAGNLTRPAHPSTDYLEELGETSCGLFFLWNEVLLTGVL